MRYAENLIQAAALAISAAACLGAQGAPVFRSFPSLAPVTLQATPAQLSFTCQLGVTALPFAPQVVSLSSSPTGKTFGVSLESCNGLRPGQAMADIHPHGGSDALNPFSVSRPFDSGFVYRRWKLPGTYRGIK
jgi:hypothetical protein